MSNQEWDTETMVNRLFSLGRLISDPKEFIEHLGRRLADGGAMCGRFPAGPGHMPAQYGLCVLNQDREIQIRRYRNVQR